MRKWKIILLFCTLIIFSLTACAGTRPPIVASFGLTDTPTSIQQKCPIRIGVNKFSESKLFSLNLKNLLVPIVPKDSISDGFTNSFVEYLHKTNLFEVVLKEPFDIEDVDIVMSGKILDLQTEEPDFEAAMGGAFLRGVTIVGILVPQYQKIIGTVEVELAVNTRKGKLIKVYKERTAATIKVQTIGVGTGASIAHFSKRPDIMEAMTKTFTKLVDNIVRDKEEVLAPIISEARK